MPFSEQGKSGKIGVMSAVIFCLLDVSIYAVSLSCGVGSRHEGL